MTLNSRELGHERSLECHLKAILTTKNKIAEFVEEAVISLEENVNMGPLSRSISSLDSHCWESFRIQGWEYWGEGNRPHLEVLHSHQPNSDHDHSHPHYQEAGQQNQGLGILGESYQDLRNHLEVDHHSLDLQD